MSDFPSAFHGCPEATKITSVIHYPSFKEGAERNTYTIKMQTWRAHMHKHTHNCGNYNRQQLYIQITEFIFPNTTNLIN